MVLDKFKGNEAFRVIGKVIHEFKSFYDNKKVMDIVAEGRKTKNSKWVLEFLEVSLSEDPEKWMNLFLVLNPDKKADDVSTSDVIRFGNEIVSDPSMMNLFFSQSRTVAPISSGSAMANTEEIEKK
jgi:hypothetical protein